MANNYLMFSEHLPFDEGQEERQAAWCRDMLEDVAFKDDEYPRWLLEAHRRGWVEEDQLAYWTDFDIEVRDDHAWISAEESGDVEAVATFVRVFLTAFPDHPPWGLTYAAWCSKPRVGEFGGGGVVVTKDEIFWSNSDDFKSRKLAELSG